MKTLIALVMLASSFAFAEQKNEKVGNMDFVIQTADKHGMGQNRSGYYGKDKKVYTFTDGKKYCEFKVRKKSRKSRCSTGGKCTKTSFKANKEIYKCW